MKSILALSILLTACATSAGALNGDRSPRLGASIDLTPRGPDTVRVVPTAIDAALPTADRIANQIRDELGTAPSVEAELCVTPAGRVASASLVRGTTMPAFDQAVLRDAASWQFDALPGPATLKTCQRTTITYVPPRA
jgi:TonB family protein